MLSFLASLQYLCKFRSIFLVVFFLSFVFSVFVFLFHCVVSTPLEYEVRTVIRARGGKKKRNTDIAPSTVPTLELDHHPRTRLFAQFVGPWCTVILCGYRFPHNSKLIVFNVSGPISILFPYFSRFLSLDFKGREATMCCRSLNIRGSRWSSHILIVLLCFKRSGF